MAILRGIARRVITRWTVGAALAAGMLLGLALWLPLSGPPSPTVLRNACLSNLRQLELAQAGTPSTGRPANVPVAELKCPAGGRYSTGRASARPACSWPGHTW